MIGSPAETLIYHITDLANLAHIVVAGGLRSDVAMAGSEPELIGYGHLKKRRATEIRVGCCGNRFVGEFVPFYFCPRSPMLYTVNQGNTGRPVGCQRTIIHLVSRVGSALETGAEWAISSGNASAAYASFCKDLGELENLDWQAIRATQWQGMTHEKSAEFLVADLLPWTAIHAIGCHNRVVAAQVAAILDPVPHRPMVSVEPAWYY